MHTLVYMSGGKENMRYTLNIGIKMNIVGSVVTWLRSMNVQIVV